MESRVCNSDVGYLVKEVSKPCVKGAAVFFFFFFSPFLVAYSKMCEREIEERTDRQKRTSL